MDLNPADSGLSVTKIALAWDALVAEGVPKEDALRRLRLSELRFLRLRRASRSIRSSIAILTPQSARMILILPTTPALRFHISPTACTASQFLSSINYRRR